MINSELSDTSEPLIHSTYGYGSQALINLMLTGRAVSYVWDNDQDVGGLSKFNPKIIMRNMSKMYCFQNYEESTNKRK